MTSPATVDRFEPDLIAAAETVGALMRDPGSPFGRHARPGHRRGIDHYSVSGFRQVLVGALHEFRARQGAHPDLANPLGFNEKIFWRKFFGEFKLPEAGNKLLTSSFIPPEAGHLVRCPEIVWHSRRPELPRNDQLAAGAYYLKANHGSAMFTRIEYPLPDDRRAGLEALGARWLANDYGLRGGEWWYNAFPRELLIERDVIGDGESTSWGFFVFGDRIPHVTMVRKRPGGDEGVWLDEALRPLPFQRVGRPVLGEFGIPKGIDAARSAALAIGRPFGFVRVDFLFDPDGNGHLGELTFSPGNGLTVRPREFELLLGSCWKSLR